eukprot:3660146-Heterocapsa_arctica.AAC.1
MTLQTETVGRLITAGPAGPKASRPTRAATPLQSRTSRPQPAGTGPHSARSCRPSSTSHIQAALIFSFRLS